MLRFGVVSVCVLVEERKRMKAAAFVCGLVVLLCSCVSAEEKPVMVDMKTHLLSKHIFRGQTRNDDITSKTEVVLNKNMFHLGFTGFADLNDENNRKGELTEVNIDLGFKMPLIDDSKNEKERYLDLVGGLKHFAYPSYERKGTTEAYVGLMGKTVWGLEPSATLSYDLDEVNGAYFSLDLQRPFHFYNVDFFGTKFNVEVCPKIGLGYGSAEYNEYYFGVDEACFSDWHAGLSVMVRKGRFEFGPSVTYTALVDDVLQKAIGDDEHVVYQFTFGVKF